MLLFLGPGMFIADLKHTGTVSVLRDQLKMEMSMEASWSAQLLSVAGDTPSGPAALLMFWCRSSLRTSRSGMEKGECPSKAGAGEHLSGHHCSQNGRKST